MKQLKAEKVKNEAVTKTEGVKDPATVSLLNLMIDYASELD